MARDLGRELRPRPSLDASAAKGIASRRGVGKIRHLDTTTLWVQRLVTDKRLELRKVLGTTNCADLDTKHLDQADLWKILTAIGFWKRSGRSNLALRAALP